MIRLLIFVILAAIVVPITYFRFKQVPLVKRLIVSCGGLVAAAIALLMQGNYAWYMVVLAIVGVSFLAAFVFMKLVEKEQLEKVRLAEERREQKKSRKDALVVQTEEKLVSEPTQKPKPFGMQSIDAEREELTRG